MDLELADRVQANLIEVYSWNGESPRGDAQLAGGELLFASPSTLPFLNGVMRERADTDAGPLLERAGEFFSSRGRGYVVFAWPGDPALADAASQAGMFTVMERYPEMICRSPLEALAAEIVPVESVEDAASYWAICDAAYPSLGFPLGLFADTFAPEELLDERVWACIAHDDGRPAACASVWAAAGVGYVGWVAATPEARGRGLAAACTVSVTNHAFNDGLDLVSLQASPMGEDLYRRLGYEELFAYTLFGAMPD
jgi:ribosomal protein S18 acetylase RimI-like enzyme